jgi:4-hydroxybenzoate polyprenyltransferase
LIRSIATLIRLKDWLKNIIIFLPLIFSGNLRYENLYLDLFITFILFSLTSSFIYIINDIVDIKEDKKHKLKLLKKPLASGKITKTFANILLFLILIILIGGFLKYKSIYPYLIFYAFINISYSLYLKKIPIIDVVLISIGYLIRLDVGVISY